MQKPSDQASCDAGGPELRGPIIYPGGMGSLTAPYQVLIKGYRWRDSNPHSDFSKTDFKSVASAISPHRHFVMFSSKPKTYINVLIYSIAFVLRSVQRTAM